MSGAPLKESRRLVAVSYSTFGGMVGRMVSKVLFEPLILELHN